MSRNDRLRLKVNPDGRLRLSPGPSIREALGDLFAFRAPPLRTRILSPTDITTIAFNRVGGSLREAMKHPRGRTGG